MINLAKLFLYFLTLSSTLYAQSTITVKSSQPACYELTNTAIQGAILKANEAAEQKCSYPVLKDIKVGIIKGVACSHVNVEATYTCD